MLFRNRVLSALAEADRDALIPHMVEAAWASGARLYEPGGPVKAAHFPSSAVLSIVSLMADGNGVECAAIGSDSAVGLLPALSGGVSSASTVVQLAGSGISISAEALSRRAGQSPGLLDLLLRFAQVVIAQEEQSVACHALHDTERRLARWLLLSQDRQASRVMSITQEALAGLLGVQRTTLSATASRLRDARLIRYSRGQLEILDRPGLEARTCECYGALRRLNTQLLTSRRPGSGPAKQAYEPGFRRARHDL